MKITNRDDSYQFDLSWYFRDRYNRLYAIASGGGMLPNFLFEEANNASEISVNDSIHNEVNSLPERFEIRRNQNLIDIIHGFNEIEDTEMYYDSFESLAKKGFYTYDKINLSNPTSSEYVLVAYPVYDTSKDDFPLRPELLELIPSIGRAIISRTNDSFDDKNFKKLDIIDVVNHSLR